MATEKQLDKLTKLVAEKIKQAQEELTKFKANLDVNPAYAFEWAKGAMYAAAQIDVLSKGQAYLIGNASSATPDDIIGNFVADLKDRVFSGARSINNHSTSNVSNAMDEHRLAAAAAFLDSLKWTGFKF